jgi:hypothetical protein
MKIPVRKLLAVDQPAPFTTQVHAGLKALASGTASEGQQVAVFNWLIKEAGGIGTQSFRKDPMETAFAEGRRFVAIQILHLTTKEVTHDD